MGDRILCSKSPACHHNDLDPKFHVEPSPAIGVSLLCFSFKCLLLDIEASSQGGILSTYGNIKHDYTQTQTMMECVFVCSPDSGMVVVQAGAGTLSFERPSATLEQVFNIERALVIDHTR